MPALKYRDPGTGQWVAAQTPALGLTQLSDVNDASAPVNNEVPTWVTDHWEWKPSFQTSVEIPDPSDLNTYTVSGQYTQSSSAEAGRGTNYPAPYAGLLEVSAITSGLMVWQRYTVYGSAWAIWQRTYYSGTWYPWSFVAGPDTGWVNLTPTSGSGTLAYRCLNGQVGIKGDLSGMTSLAAGQNQAVAATGAIPAAYRPGSTVYAMANGGGALTCQVVLGSTGNLSMWNSSASAVTVFRCNFTYMLG